ncbi:hypothetical protein CcaCcLH18_12370 [Colletotrichum camelliae]|nr:hypothetical protein CcaCcLH18_12370 [Colletotrichum camelliae]
MKPHIPIARAKVYPMNLLSHSPGVLDAREDVLRDPGRPRHHNPDGNACGEDPVVLHLGLGVCAIELGYAHQVDHKTQARCRVRINTSSQTIGFSAPDKFFAIRPWPMIEGINICIYNIIHIKALESSYADKDKDRIVLMSNNNNTFSVKTAAGEVTKKTAEKAAYSGLRTPTSQSMRISGFKDIAPQAVVDKAAECGLDVRNMMKMMNEKRPELQLDKMLDNKFTTLLMIKFPRMAKDTSICMNYYKGIAPGMLGLMRIDEDELIA